MTPEQIQNWRDFLRIYLGDQMADEMPVGVIGKVRDLYQHQINVAAIDGSKRVEQKIGNDGLCQHKVNPKHCRVCS